MAVNLRDLTRGFVNGTVSRESLHNAAKADRSDRALANQIIGLYTEWENSSWTDRDLRERVERII